ncbi:MAG: acyl-CoA thioesterase [Spirochaetaceae bacterium]|nr:acyl-CoA thioesterase [Spirochaetaceae bacterium]
MTIQVEVVRMPHVNGSSRLFGGQLMAWIDSCAAVEARRHCKKRVVTANVDNLEFYQSAGLNEIVRLEARLTWTGRTSMEVRVDSFVEPLTSEERLINRAFLVFVALDEEGKPSPVPAFVPRTEEEKTEWAEAEERRQIRLERRLK